MIKRIIRGGSRRVSDAPTGAGIRPPRQHGDRM